MNFKNYGRTNVAEMAEYEEGALLGAQVSISAEDSKAGSPKAGDMIARNPTNHKDQWLVAKKYFEENFGEVVEFPGGESFDANVKSNKYLRVGLDERLQELKSLPGSRERSLAITKLQECIMWLGMDLKRLNDSRPPEAEKQSNPYPDSYKPGNTKIAPTADGLKL